jgi:hypothetical protein
MGAETTKVSGSPKEETDYTVATAEHVPINMSIEPYGPPGKSSSLERY